MNSNVYLLRAGPYAKIGKANDVRSRVRQLQTACPERIEVMFVKQVCCSRHAAQVESELHDLMVYQRTYGEWFEGGVKVESCFVVSFGHAISRCPDIMAAASCVAMFHGLSHGEDFDFRDDFLSYPSARSYGVHLLLPVELSGSREIGYAIDYTDSGHQYVSGWYDLSPTRIRITDFDGAWSECDPAAYSKAERDWDSVTRNELLTLRSYPPPLLLSSPDYRP